MMCLGVDFFVYHIWCCSATCIYRFTYFTKVGKFSAIISLGDFLISFYCFPLGSQRHKLFVFFCFPTGLWNAIHLFSVYFLFIVLGEFIVYLQVQFHPVLSSLYYWVQLVSHFYPVTMIFSFIISIWLILNVTYLFRYYIILFSSREVRISY